METLINNMSIEELENLVDSATPVQMEMIARRAISLGLSGFDLCKSERSELEVLRSWAGDCPI